MKAADMTTRVVTIADEATVNEATVNEAAQLMLQHRISVLLVVDGSGKLVGVVIEGDLMRRAELGTERQRPWWLELLTSNRRLAAKYVQSHAHKTRVERLGQI